MSITYEGVFPLQEIVLLALLAYKKQWKLLVFCLRFALTHLQLNYTCFKLDLSSAEILSFL